jgi:hypothetical protein
LWKAVLSRWELGPHELELLRLACEALDRCEEAREAVARDGAYVEGRFGLKAHPALAVERDARIGAAGYFASWVCRLRSRCRRWRWAGGGVGGPLVARRVSGSRASPLYAAMARRRLSCSGTPSSSSVSAVRRLGEGGGDSRGAPAVA